MFNPKHRKKKTKQAETETESESESESKPENQKPKPNGVELEMEALGLKYFTGNLRKRNPTATICSTHFLRPRSLCEKSKSQKLNPIMPARGAHTYPYLDMGTHAHRKSKNPTRTHARLHFEISHRVWVFGLVFLLPHTHINLYTDIYIYKCIQMYTLFFSLFVSHPHPGSQCLFGPISRVTTRIERALTL